MAATTQLDGRSARRGRNKDSVIEAAIELIYEGNVSPGVTEIAERAGVSYRSVFRYFPDRDDVIAAALDVATNRLEDNASGMTGPLPEQRIALWEESAPVARSLRLGASQSEAIAHRLKVHRQFMRKQAKSAYEPQLSKLAKSDQAAAIAGIDLATSFEGFESFRYVQRMSQPRATEAMDRLVKRSLRK